MFSARPWKPSRSSARLGILSFRQSSLIAAAEFARALAIGFSKPPGEMTEVAEASRESNLGDLALRQPAIQKIVACRIEPPLPYDFLNGRAARLEQARQAADRDAEFARQPGGGKS